MNRLDRLEALLKLATKGPVHACEDVDGVPTVAPGSDCSARESFIAICNGMDDARFLAEAHNLMPDLIKLARVVEKFMDTTDEDNQHLCDIGYVLEDVRMLIPAEPGSLPDAPPKEFKP